MSWGNTAMDGAGNSRLAADRFVTGALRRIRIRAKVKKLRWMEATIQRSSAREMEERCSTRE
jgi:hypothetical protein